MHWNVRQYKQGDWPPLFQLDQNPSLCDFFCIKVCVRSLSEKSKASVRNRPNRVREIDRLCRAEGLAPHRSWTVCRWSPCKNASGIIERARQSILPFLVADGIGVRDGRPMGEKGGWGYARRISYKGCDVHVFKEALRFVRVMWP